MLLAKDARSVRGHAAERPPSLVPVAQLLRGLAQLGRDRQHDRIGVAEPPLPGGERLLQHPAGRRRVAALAVDAGQLVRGGQDGRIILAQRIPRIVERGLEQVPGS
jgi:hypothetical protein